MNIYYINRLALLMASFVVFASNSLMSSEPSKFDPVERKREIAQDNEDALQEQEQNQRYEDFTARLRNNQECIICHEPFVKQLAGGTTVSTASILLPCCKQLIHATCQKDWSYDNDKNACCHCRQPFTSEQAHVWQSEAGLFMSNEEEDKVSRKLNYALAKMPPAKRLALLMLFTSNFKQHRPNILAAASSLVDPDDVNRARKMVVLESIAQAQAQLPADEAADHNAALTSLARTNNKNLIKLVHTVTRKLTAPESSGTFAKRALKQIVIRGWNPALKLAYAYYVFKHHKSWNQWQKWGAKIGALWASGQLDLTFNYDEYLSEQNSQQNAFKKAIVSATQQDSILANIVIASKDVRFKQAISNALLTTLCYPLADNAWQVMFHPFLLSLGAEAAYVNASAFNLL